jgi:hypothetical protein
MPAVRRVVAVVVVLVLLGVVAVAVYAATSGGNDEPSAARFEQEGAFAFTYPPDFTKVFTPQKQIAGRDPLYQVLYGTDDANWVLVATYDTKTPVDLADPADVRAVDLAAKHLADATGWQLGERSDGKLGPLQAVSYPLEKIEEGREGRLVYAFSGPTQYFLRCEWDIDGEATIPGGCDQIQATMEPLAAVPASTSPASTAPAGTATGASTAGS